MAKPAEVTTPEQTELLAVTRTHSGALTRYAEGKSLKKVLHEHPSLPNLKPASMPVFVITS